MYFLRGEKYKAVTDDHGLSFWMCSTLCGVTFLPPPHLCVLLNDFVPYSSELVSLKLVRMLGHGDSGLRKKQQDGCYPEVVLDAGSVINQKID